MSSFIIIFGFGQFSYAAVSSETKNQSLSYTPVTTPNGSTLPWTLDNDGSKVFNLTVEECKHEVAPGMVINAWCYNGQTPGPTIEAVEGDHVKIYVTNKLSEITAVHWHGVRLPNGMDGVSGLTQKPIQPGETFLYEFTLKQHGTQMYHSHGDEMVQMGLGTMGFFIIHPKDGYKHKIDRDFAIFLNEWFVAPGSARPDASVMTDFNIFTFNSRAFPGTEPLVAKTGDRVRIRIANVGQESHPIHLHGFQFKIVGTDGGEIPESAQWPETTVAVFPGQTRDVEFVADAPGDWALHCHRRHHPMNAMGHGIPNMIGVSQKGEEENVRELLPNYMAMGETGMHEMVEHASHMQGPVNTLPMMGGEGQFGPVGMGGMFTVLKVRDNLKDYNEPGLYNHPSGTVAESINKPNTKVTGVPMEGKTYVCPMHPEVRQNSPGKCPKCGMDLKPKG
ncbi:MAG: multicopper oxidase domain-containing protein [Syntrophales bacterium]|nr:multicopper oxidase domain-containing protein [Syntrophales bacterium]